MAPLMLQETPPSPCAECAACMSLLFKECNRWVFPPTHTRCDAGSWKQEVNAAGTQVNAGGVAL